MKAQTVIFLGYLIEREKIYMSREMVPANKPPIPSTLLSTVVGKDISLPTLVLHMWLCSSLKGYQLTRQILKRLNIISVSKTVSPLFNNSE